MYILTSLHVKDNAVLFLKMEITQFKAWHGIWKITLWGEELSAERPGADACNKDFIKRAYKTGQQTLKWKGL